MAEDAKDKKDEEQEPVAETTEVSEKPTEEESAYDKGWEEGEKDDDPASPDAGGEKDEGLPAKAPDESAPQASTPPVSKEYGSIESMEQSVKDTKKYASNLQTEVLELQAKVKAYEDGTATEKDVEDARQGVENAKDAYDEVKARVYTDYPELQGLIDPMIEANRELKRSNDELNKKVNTFTASQEEVEATNRLAVIRKNFDENIKPYVLEKHADFGTILEKEYPVFESWAKLQDEKVRDAALYSDDPGEIIEAVTAYKAWKATGAKESLLDDQERRKQERLNNAQTLRGGSVPMSDTRNPKKDDYDGGWAEAERAERAAGAT